MDTPQALATVRMPMASQPRARIRPRLACRISCREAAAGDRGNRFSALNTMGLCLAMKDDRRLKEAMVRYVTESQAAKELFPLAE